MRLDEILDDVASQAKRWEHGELTDYEFSSIVKRANRRLEKTCYCDQGVCCDKHGTHSSPHMNCILR